MKKASGMLAFVFGVWRLLDVVGGFDSYRWAEWRMPALLGVALAVYAPVPFFLLVHVISLVQRQFMKEPGGP